MAVAFLEDLQDQKFPGEAVTLIWGWGSGINKLNNFYVRLLFKCIQEHTKQNKKKPHKFLSSEAFSLFRGACTRVYSPDLFSSCF